MNRRITITRDGYLASLPKTGPGLVMRSKMQKVIFGADAAGLGWDVRMAGEPWNVSASPGADVLRMASSQLSGGYRPVRDAQYRLRDVTPWGKHA